MLSLRTQKDLRENLNSLRSRFWRNRNRKFSKTRREKLSLTPFNFFFRFRFRRARAVRRKRGDLFTEAARLVNRRNSRRIIKFLENLFLRNRSFRLKRKYVRFNAVRATECRKK